MQCSVRTLITNGAIYYILLYKTSQNREMYRLMEVHQQIGIIAVLVLQYRYVSRFKLIAFQLTRSIINV